MKRCLLFATVLLGACALRADEDETDRTIHIQWSARDVMKMQDWSGRAEISAGKIVRVEKDSGASDTIREDGSWEIVYGRSLKGDPKTAPRKKSLFITVQAANDAIVMLKTKGGDFSFRVGEVTATGIERLDGNVRVSWGREPASTAKEAKRAGKGKKKATAAGRGENADEELGRKSNLPPASFAGEIKAQRVSDGVQQSDWPAVAVTAAGTAWCAWVEWNGKDADRVLASHRPPAGAWTKPVVLDDRCWDHYAPAVVALGKSNEVLVVWSGQKGDGNFELYAAQVGADGKQSRVEQLTRAPHPDFNVRAASDAAGNVTIVWQSSRDGRSDIYARQRRDSTWGPELRVSPSDANDWEPAIALDSAGRAWISWDSYERGNYDVFLRPLGREGKPGDIIAVTTEPAAQFHSTVAVDRHDRVWIAWDEAGENWGKDYSTSSAAPGSRGLHFSRTLGIRVLEGGRLRAPEVKVAAIMTGRMTRYAELPQLAMDGAGAMWLVFRHWTDSKPREQFDFCAARLDGGKWAGPWRLGNSSGRNSQNASVALAPDGNLLVAYSSDGRSATATPAGDQMHDLHYQVFASTLEKSAAAGEVKFAEVKLPPASGAFAARQRATMTAASKSYTLLYGDCHRHTDIRGHSAVDGSILDTLRYGRDAAQLDFMGFGDHNEVFGGRWPDGLRDYTWWWSQKATELHSSPPAFVGVFSYEHSMGSPAGHRNIIFTRRGAPLRPIDRSKTDDNLPPNFWKWVEANVLTQPGQKCVIVPHTFAAGPLASWDWPNARFDCLLEMYQGARGSYEALNVPPGEKRGGTQTKKPGHFAQDALARGNRYGFVSFSDHGSTHTSWAGVWASDVSREGIIDAMLARRTQASSDEIVLDVTADGHAPGEEFRAKTAPEIKITAKACDTILRVDVCKNGEYIWTQNPKAREFSATFRDARVKPGTSYYYVRLFQRDPNAPDGDPHIAWASPFFVIYE